MVVECSAEELGSALLETIARHWREPRSIPLRIFLIFSIFMDKQSYSYAY